MTKFQLASLLFQREAAVVTLEGFSGFLLSIEREDVSGSSFNVKLSSHNGEERIVYVRTVD